MPSLSRIQVGLSALTLAFAIGILSPGLASADSGFSTWYGPGFQGNTMYNGQPYDMYDPTTTACNIFPLGTWIQVTNPANGRSVIVQVRDRGGFSYALDLSYAAFKLIADPALMGIPVSYQVVSGPSGVPIPPRAAPSSRSGRPAPSGQYVVQSGDTLDGIADQTGVNASNLAAWNGLADPDQVTAGQVLKLAAAASSASTAAPAGRTYVVQPGDTLLGIAQRLGVSADRLAGANQVSDPDSIAIGQTLSIPAGAASARAPRTYAVQAGDSLSSIAQTFGITVDRLISVNNVGDPSLIQPGAQLTIPGP
ncbi:MAG: LysM peptidoglycan-binding domain-containing protein [Chloroflexota bacterium]